MRQHDATVTPDGLVHVLARMPTAAPILSELSAALGLEGDPLADLLESAELSGLIERWDSSNGLAIVLTPEAADAGGLRLEEVTGGCGRFLFKWVSRDAPQPAVKCRAKRGTILASVLAGGDLEDDYLDELPDPNAEDPGEVAATSEDADRALRAPGQAKEKGTREPFLPFPKIILGLRPQWNGEPAGDGPCEGCGGLELDRVAACVMCGRTGVDYLIPPLPKRVVRMTKCRSKGDGLTGGTGAAAKAGKPRGAAKADAERAAKNSGVEVGSRGPEAERSGSPSTMPEPHRSFRIAHDAMRGGKKIRSEKRFDTRKTPH